MKRFALTHARRFAFTAALGLPAALLVTSTASASPTYPDYVKDALELTESVKCTLCHDTPAGGYGTLNDIGTYLKSKTQLEPKRDKAEVTKALEKWEKGQDTDDDDVPDLEELKAGSDPNDKNDKPGGGSGGSGGSGKAGGGGREGGASGGGSGRGDAGRNSGRPGAQTGQATSAGCSYADAPADRNALALLAAAAAALVPQSRRRRRPTPLRPPLSRCYPIAPSRRTRAVAT
jgi:hypothetical protein